MLFRQLKQATKNIIYNGHSSFFSWLTMTAAMLLLGLSLLAIINVEQLTAKWNNIHEVTLYLDDDLTLTEQERIVTLLSRYPQIKSAARIDPATTFDDFVALGEEAAKLVKGLDISIFPPAVLLSLDTDQVTAANFSAFVATLQTVPAITAIDYGQFEHEQVSTIAIMVRAATTFCALLVTMLMLFIVFNTIKVAIFNRREEIDIQWLVGATMSFIKGPMILEQFLIGALSGASAALLLTLAQLFLATPVNTILHEILPAFTITFYSPLLWWVLITTGALMAIIGAWLALRKLS